MPRTTVRDRVGLVLGPPTLVAAAVGAAGASYIGLLTVLSRRGRAASGDLTRFAIVVPAHDESATIGATLASLGQVDYPPQRVEVIVVADNCSDDTAEVARRSTATVIERVDPSARGKGYALALAFDTILETRTVDAVVVIDADTIVSTNLLRAISARIEQGASAVQVDYRVRNPGASWRTRLLDVAFTCSHLVRGEGRMRLGASAGLRGNGMAFTTGVLSAVPHRAHSAVEDLEYGIDLGRAGVRVEFVSDAYVAGDMPSGGRDSRSQRTRWELGRAEIRRRTLAPLVREAASRRDIVLADLALDLATPPLSTLGLTLAGAGALGRCLPPGRSRRTTTLLVMLGSTCLVAHIAAGVVRSQSRLKAVPAMMMAPFYAAWKLWLATSSGWKDQRKGETLWTRTSRSPDAVTANPLPEPTRPEWLHTADSSHSRRPE